MVEEVHMIAELQGVIKSADTLIPWTTPGSKALGYHPTGHSDESRDHSCRL